MKCLGWAPLLAAGALGSPVVKVISLLKDIKGKIQNEVKVEEVAMAEYKQWCNDEPARRRFEIKQAQKDINSFNGIIEDSKSKMANSQADVNSLSAEVTVNEQDVKKGSEQRAKALSLFQKEEQELRETIDMIARAVSILKRLSFAQDGKVNQEQFKQLTNVLSLIIEAANTKDDSKRKLKSFLSMDDDLSLPQANVTNYETHGGTHQIVETLQEMKDQAESQLSALRSAEMNGAHNWAMEKQSLQDATKYAKEKIANSQQVAQEAGQEKGLAEADLANTTKDKNADEAFLAEAVPACSNKAQEWEKRQQSAQAEITAVQQAIETLSSKFGFIEMKAVKRHLSRNVEDDRRSDAVRFLKQMSRKFSSFGLLEIANVAAKGGPFAKVKGLIADMISKLQDEAIKEATQDAYCKEEKKTNETNRDKKQAASDKYASRIDKATAGIAKLKEGVAALEKELTEISKTGAELTAMRNKEHSNFVETEKDLKESVEAVSAALTTLKDFYNKAGAFVQLKQESNQEPELGEVKTESSSVVIGILEQAEADFSKNLAEAQTDESSSASEYERVTQANKVATASKTSSLQGKKNEITNFNSALERHKADHSTVNQELDAILTYLEKLSQKCANRAMTYEEKQEKRNNEIAGLKEALEILEGEQPALLQKKAFLSRKN